METIIYFQKKRGLREPLIEPIGMKTYLLVRVSLDVAREAWFGLGMEEPKAPVFGGGMESDTEKCKINRWLHPLKYLRNCREEVASRQQECERRFTALRDYHIWMEQCWLRLQQIEVELQALMKNINQLSQPEQPVWAVYEDGLRSILIGDGRGDGVRPGYKLQALWKQYVELSEFEDYTKLFWIEQTLPEHLPHRFVILGRNLSICPVLERYSCRLKSIRWLLAERECTTDFLEYLEYFYEEYGLVISYRTFSDVNQLRRADLSCEAESVIFDFSNDVCVQTAAVARGSIWVDLYSMEEKQKKMECRNPGVMYFSLKKKWKQVQKVRNKPFFLDTVKENGYNTWESEGIL